MVKVMFLFTRNSCRSQMAEGFARRYGGDALEVYSAGLTPAGVNENAAKVMAELGIDISRPDFEGHRPRAFKPHGHHNHALRTCGIPLPGDSPGNQKAPLACR